jgi:hypothetical protein
LIVFATENGMFSNTLQYWFSNTQTGC